MLLYIALSFALSLLAFWLEQSYLFFNFFFSLSVAGIIGAPIFIVISFLFAIPVFYVEQHVKQQHIRSIAHVFFLFIVHFIMFYMLAIWTSFCATMYLTIENNRLIENGWIYFTVAFLFNTWHFRATSKTIQSDLDTASHSMNTYEYSTNRVVQIDKKNLLFSTIWGPIVYTFLFILLIIFPNWNIWFLGSLIPKIVFYNNIAAFIGGAIFFFALLKWVILPIIILLTLYIKRKHS